MTAQAAKVEKAIELMHSRYQKNRDKLRAFEEKQEGITITVTSSELNLLRLLVSDRVGQEHNVWYETTHDELLDVDTMAYELAGCTLREDRLHRILGKLDRENT